MEVYVLGERGEQDYDWSAPDVIIAVYGDKESAINAVKELINVNVYQKDSRVSIQQ